MISGVLAMICHRSTHMMGIDLKIRFDEVVVGSIKKKLDCRLAFIQALAKSLWRVFGNEKAIINRHDSP